MPKLIRNHRSGDSGWPAKGGLTANIFRGQRGENQVPFSYFGGRQRAIPSLPLWLIAHVWLGLLAPAAVFKSASFHTTEVEITRETISIHNA